jgi:hypothetical protein
MGTARNASPSTWISVPEASWMTGGRTYLTR